jgi:hypothetical protein
MCPLPFSPSTDPASSVLASTPCSITIDALLPMGSAHKTSRWRRHAMSITSGLDDARHASPEHGPSRRNTGASWWHQVHSHHTTPEERTSPLLGANHIEHWKAAFRQRRELDLAGHDGRAIVQELG